MQCAHELGGVYPYQVSSDDESDMQSDAESHMPSAAPAAGAVSHLPSNAQDKKSGRASCWSFEITLVVGAEYVAGNKISPKIVKPTTHIGKLN